MLELLAPAGSMEALRAAVQNGADAVYLGAGAFHARQAPGILQWRPSGRRCSMRTCGEWRYT